MDRAVLSRRRELERLPSCRDSELRGKARLHLGEMPGSRTGASEKNCSCMNNVRPKDYSGRGEKEEKMERRIKCLKPDLKAEQTGFAYLQDVWPAGWTGTQSGAKRWKGRK